MSLRKDFSSLRKQRYSGTSPKNLLDSPVHKITVPSDPELHKGALYIVNPLNLAEIERSQDVRTCFFLPIAIIDNGLAEVAKVSLGVSRIDYNLQNIEASAEIKVRLRVSPSEEHLFFVRGKAYLDKMVIPKDAIRKLACNDDCLKILIVLEKKFGYFFIEFTKPYPKFVAFLAIWLESRLTTLTEDELISLHDLCIKKRRDLQRDPQTYEVVSRSTAEHDDSERSDDILRNGLASEPGTTAKIYMGRKTRAVTKLLNEDPEILFHADITGEMEEDDNLADEDEPVIQETPAPFDPPLKHTLRNGKKFIVAYNDFKTLYNNDWINDTLIDFFIAYEIDKAVNEIQLIAESKVYAFNSFFFTKLMSKSEEQEVPDYYENIKRWLSKIDLMSYEAIIMPINEHLHWYCCVIKNLPKLLRYGKRAQKRAARGLEKEPTPPNLDPVTEIFVFDSLRQTHPNIVAPLKALIAEYCKDKHGIEVDMDLIRVVTARVPRQRNFNDCGIHVIYNVKKWLAEPPICERMWKKFAKNQKNYFSGAERSGLRKTFIDILLDLHAKQEPLQSDDSSRHSGENASDDEIELISYHCSKPEEAEKNGIEEKLPIEDVNIDTSEETTRIEANGVEYEAKLQTPEPGKKSKDQAVSAARKAQDEGPREETKGRSTAELSPTKSANTRTLDPRALDATDGDLMKSGKTATGAAYQIEHPQIRRLCMKIRLKPHTVKFLNEFFENHFKSFDDEKQILITDFVSNFNYFNPQLEVKQCELLINKFRDALQEPIAPMDEPFVIEEVEESGEELNRSVSDLHISSEERMKRRHRKSGGSTPEATRKFLKDSESDRSLSAEGPEAGIISRTTAQAHLKNDFEILEDDVQIVLEREHDTSVRQMRLGSTHKLESQKSRSQLGSERTSVNIPSVVRIRTNSGSSPLGTKNTVVTILDDESGKGKNGEKVKEDELIVRAESLGPKRRRVQSSSYKSR